MANPKIKNAQAVAPQVYDETNDNYSPVSSSSPLPVSVAGSTSAYAVRYDKASSTVEYVGKATVGSNGGDAVWQIFRMTTTSGDITIEYADGDALFDNEWDSRASLSYS